MAPVGDVVGRTGSPTVAREHPGERSEAAERVGVRFPSPEGVDVQGPVGEHEIDPTLPNT